MVTAKTDMPSRKSMEDRSAIAYNIPRDIKSGIMTRIQVHLLAETKTRKRPVVPEKDLKVTCTYNCIGNQQ